MHSYITGSRAYGFPRADSDIDLVIACSFDDAAVLWKASDNPPKCTFGPLNLIIFVVDTPEGIERFQSWFAIHNQLVASRPVTRDVAVAAFQSVGFGDEIRSGVVITNDDDLKDMSGDHYSFVEPEPEPI
jgi:hypothetical protein